MGVSRSQICSTLDRDEDCKLTEAHRPCRQSYPQAMQLGTMDSLHMEKVDRWTKNLGPAVECSDVAAVLSCGATVNPPVDYVADMQGDGVVVLDPHSQMPMWIEEADERDFSDDMWGTPAPATPAMVVLAHRATGPGPKAGQRSARVGGRTEMFGAGPPDICGIGDVGVAPL